ncbi:MAG TPA: HAD family hydrolase, partial [Actinomycetes bacterium]|nr:HAD family hydrolase [Actinomycetes bacterium]
APAHRRPRGRAPPPGRVGRVVAQAAILDVDGTLVDTNYQHALAWYRALRQHDFVVPIWRIHRAIGMGGDQLLPHLIGEVQPFADARRLMELLADRGHRLVLASSGQRHDIEHYLDLLDARGLLEAWTSSADVERTKPDPDLVVTAVSKVGGGAAVLVGDSTFDCEAAARAGVPTVAILTGGFSEQELRQAGAVSIHESLTELCERLDDTPLAKV